MSSTTNSEALIKAVVLLERMSDQLERGEERRDERTEILRRDLEETRDLIREALAGQDRAADALVAALAQLRVDTRHDLQNEIQKAVLQRFLATSGVGRERERDTGKIEKLAAGGELERGVGSLVVAAVKSPRVWALVAGLLAGGHALRSCTPVVDAMRAPPAVTHEAAKEHER